MPTIPGKVGGVGSLGAYLREQREHAKLSVRQLAALAGVSNPYLSQIERGLRKPSAEVLQQLAKGLRISAEVLYVQAGILDDEHADGHEAPDVRAAVRADPSLSDRQKRLLLDLYATFREENAHEGDPAAQAGPGSHDEAGPPGGPPAAPSPAPVDGD